MVPWLISVALFVVGFTLASQNQLILGGETLTNPEPLSFFIKNMSLWNNEYGFGLPNIYFISFHYHLLMAALSSVFGVVIAQKLFIGATLSLSFFGCYNLLRYVLPKQNTYTYSIASLFYICNPFMVMMFTWLPSYSYAFMFFPLIAKLSLKFIDAKATLRNWFLLSVCLFFATPLAQNLGLFGLVAIFPFLYLLYLLYLHPERYKEWIGKGLSIMAALFTANAFWLIPLLLFYQSAFGGAVVYETNFTHPNYLVNPILRGLTFNQYYWFDKANEVGQLYYSYYPYYRPLSQFIGLGLVLLITTALLARKRLVQQHAKIDFFFALFLIGVFLSKGTAPPFGEVYAFLLKYLPLFALYRSSDIKFPLWAVLSMSVLLAFAIQSIKIPYKRVLIGLLAIGVFVLGLPYYTQAIFPQKYYVNIPEYWQEFTQLQRHHQDRVLLLPRNHSPFDNYTWGYEGGWLTAQLLDQSSIGYTKGYGPSVQEKAFASIEEAYTYLEEENPNEFLKSLGYFNIGTILHRKDFDLNRNVQSSLSYGRLDPAYLPEKLTPMLGSFLPSKQDLGQLEIYTVPEQYKTGQFVGRDLTYQKVNNSIYVIQNLDTTNGSSIAFLDSYDPNWKVFKRPSFIQPPCQEQSVETQHIQIDFWIGQQNYRNGVVKTCSPLNGFVSLRFVPFLFMNDQSGQMHDRFMGYANSWQLPNSTDGSDYVIVFIPQLLFILGLSSSGVVLFFVLCLIGLQQMRKTKVK